MSAARAPLRRFIPGLAAALCLGCATPEAARDGSDSAQGPAFPAPPPGVALIADPGGFTPRAVGWRWDYELVVTQGGQVQSRQEQLREVTREVELEGRRGVELRYETKGEGAKQDGRITQSSGDGLWELEASGERRRWRPVLPGRMWVGQRWLRGGPGGELRFEVVGLAESVTAGGRRYADILIVEARSSPPELRGELIERSYYARGVGLVRADAQLGPFFERRMELTEFEMGGGE